jgi:hypothetical protein
MKRLTIVPCTREEANTFVAQHHRHHGPVVSHKFSLAVAEEDRVVGVAMVGRPVARMLDDGFTLEVTRCCTDGTKDAASMLYGACRRAVFALGYRKLVTYTLQTESGISLRAAGFKVLGEVRGKSWSCPSRPRVDLTPLQKKFRWEISA